MEKAVLLAVAASLCTATASVCQRAGARNTGPAALAGEALALAVVIVGATALSRSCLLHGEDPHPPHPAPPALTSAAHPRHRQPAAAGRP